MVTEAAQPTPAGATTGPGWRDRLESPGGRAALAAALFGFAIVVAHQLLPLGAPAGILLRGTVVGALGGFIALGLVFIYRANSIINFAQGEMGAFAAVLTFELVLQTKLPYVLAVTLSVLAAIVLAVGLELAVLRRFSEASRLIATVVTIGLAQILLFLQIVIPLLFERYSAEVQAGRLAFPSPFSGEAFTISGVVFSHDSLIALVVVVGVVVGLTLFLRRSWMGTAIRAAAQNRDRAALLGVPVAWLGTISWGFAGGLSALAAILRAPLTGYFPGTLGGPALLARALAAAAIGRFESFTVTFVAAIGITVVETLYLYSFAEAGPLDALVLAIVIVALLVRAGKTARASWGATSSWQSIKEVRPLPDELRALREVRLAKIGLVAVGVLLMAIVPPLLNTNHVRLISVVWVFAMVAVSLVILTGWAGQVSLGQWAIVGVGGFVTARLSTSALAPNFVIVLLVAGLVAAVVSVILGLPALRLRGIFYGVTTLVFAVASTWLFGLDFLQPRGFIPRPIFLGTPLDSELQFLYVVSAIGVLVMLAARNLRTSRAGRLLIASRDNEKAVATFGVSVVTARLTAFAVSGFICGVAGSLYVFLVRAAELTDFGPERSILLFGLAVIGGLGSIAGAILGAVYVLGSQYFLPSWGSFLATGLGVILFLLAFPGGLGELLFSFRDRLLARLAAGRQLLVPSLVADRSAEEFEVVSVPFATATDETEAVEDGAEANEEVPL